MKDQRITAASFAEAEFKRLRMSRAEKTLASLKAKKQDARRKPTLEQLTLLRTALLEVSALKSDLKRNRK